MVVAGGENTSKMIHHLYKKHKSSTGAQHLVWTDWNKNNKVKANVEKWIMKINSSKKMWDTTKCNNISKIGLPGQGKE